jgi:phage gpG-like protein
VLLELSLAGDVQVRRKLLRVGERAVHARPAFEAIGEALFRIERDQFDSEGRRGGTGWAALKPATIAQRGTAHPILDDSGALKASLTERGGDNTFWAADDFLLFGSKLDYAGFHQTGTGDAKGVDQPGEDVKGMARRRPLEPTEAEKVGLVKILQGYIFGDEATSLAMAAALGA